jgi:hypothetical protein
MVKSENNNNNNITIYQSNDGQISFNVNVFEETVWLTQKQMAELFDKDQRTISEHISNIFKDGELEENSVYRNFQYTASDGKVYKTKHYNLDVIISVGYRVKSQRGIQFRRWATGILKQYLLNGYAINEQRIKAIEDKIDNLSIELKKELKAEINQVNKSLLEIANRPITINNQISLAGHKLEEKAAELLDEIIEQIKDEKVKNQLNEVKKDITTLPKNKKTKKNILQFFSKLGDDNSDLSKTIKGVGISKKIISELIKLGEKLKDFIL